MPLKRLAGLILLAGVAAPAVVLAAISAPATAPDLTGTWLGILSLVIFFAAYALIISEEAIRLRKSKPIMVAAGLIWLLVATVVISVGGGNSRFVAVACINIVVAANAGGVFSPFGDITTLMVWQKNIIDFTGFFALFVPAVVNWLVVALILNFAVRRLRRIRSRAGLS
jgi:hypothetical protein